MLRHIAPYLLVFPLAAAAQAPAVPKATLEELSKDLAKLQHAVMEAQTALQTQRTASQSPTGDATATFGSPEWKAMMTRSMADTVVITAANTKIRAGADSKAMWIADGSKGMKFPIIDRAGDWYAVGLSEPVKGFQTGWISAENVVPEKTTTLVTASTMRPVTVDNSAGGCPEFCV